LLAAFKQKTKRSSITVKDSLLIKVLQNEKCWAVDSMIADFLNSGKWTWCELVYNIYAWKILR